MKSDREKKKKHNQKIAKGSGSKGRNWTEQPRDKIWNALILHKINEQIFLNLDNIEERKNLTPVSPYSYKILL